MRINLATRSLLLSVGATCFLGYSLTVGLTDPHSLLKHIPDWLSLPLIVGIAVIYLLAVWWACRGFREHKITALASLAFCTLGLGVYAAGFSLEMGKGKAAPGQYDYQFTTLDPGEREILAQLTEEAGLSLKDAVFTEHWHLADPATGFRVCVQKGRITALNFSNHPVKSLGKLSQMPNLGDLYLKNCGLSDMSELRSGKLDRLDVSDNQITDLKTLRGCPNLRWLTAERNRLQSTEGIDQFPQLISSDFAGNPLR
jgi:Leucine-rich repeat (LRR) protein